MEAGKLRHRLEIQEATEQQDSVGEPIKTWSKLRTVWGSVQPLSGREYLLSQQVTPEQTHRIMLRYTPELTVRHRIVFDSRHFDINSIIDVDERHIELELLCSEAK